MSVWQLMAAAHGWQKANTPRDSGKLTEAEAQELFEWLESAPAEERVLSTQTYWWDGDKPEPRGVVTFTVA